MSSPLEQYRARLDKATASRGGDGVPFAAIVAADSSGKLLSKIESGTFMPHEKNPSRNGTERQPFTADTVCWIASCTKLMTTLAVLQCVERGLFTLDEDISTTWLPEFAAQSANGSTNDDTQVLLRLDEDADGNEQPVYQPRRQPLTLRHLLTHSSGIAYEFTHPKLQGWRSWSLGSKAGRAQARSSEVAEAMRVPLLFEPGEGWVYGYGLDWAGVAVMRASGNQTLEAYMAAHIWGPLGMQSTTFSLARHRPDLYARYAGMTTRDDEGALEDGDGGPIASNIERTHYAGGGGCFSTAIDYLALLTSLLRTVTSSSSSSSSAGDSSTHHLVSPATARTMFTPQLSPTATSALQELEASPLAFGLAGNLSRETTTSFGLGGILNTARIPSCGRAPGGLQWGGLPNLQWWISPADGVCGCYFSQCLPPGDQLSFALYREFERALLLERQRESGSVVSGGAVGGAKL